MLQLCENCVSKVNRYLSIPFGMLLAKQYGYNIEIIGFQSLLGCFDGDFYSVLGQAKESFNPFWDASQQ